MPRWPAGSFGCDQAAGTLLPGFALAGCQKALRPDVSPALLLQFHDPHDARLHKRRLGEKRDGLVLRLTHIFLGVAAGLERDRWRFLGNRLDAILYRRGVVSQHVKAGTEGNDFDFYLLAEGLVVLLNVGRVIKC